MIKRENLLVRMILETLYCLCDDITRALIHQGVAQSIIVQRPDTLHMKVGSVRRLVLSHDLR